MLKDVGKVVEYSEKLCNIQELAEMHKLISSHTRVSDYLIYSDRAFPAFLEKKVLLSPAEKIYLIVAPNSIVGGFCRLKTLEECVFLNNIYIKKEYQGRGYGKELLYHALKEVANLHQREFFSLDVFQSNESATKWYSSLGMKRASSTVWFQINRGRDEKTSITSHLITKTNEAGFKDAFLENRIVGSVLNDNLIVKSFDDVDKLLESGIDRIVVKTSEQIPDEISQNRNLRVQLLEVSVRMNGSLADVLRNLAN